MLRIVISDSFDRSQTSYSAYEVLIFSLLEELGILSKLGLCCSGDGTSLQVVQLIFEQYTFCSDGSIIVRVSFFAKEGDFTSYDEILLELRDRLGDFLSSQPALNGSRIQVDVQQEKLGVGNFPKPAKQQS